MIVYVSHALWLRCSFEEISLHKTSLLCTRALAPGRPACIFPVSTRRGVPVDMDMHVHVRHNAMLLGLCFSPRWCVGMLVACMSATDVFGIVIFLTIGQDF